MISHAHVRVKASPETINHFFARLYSSPPLHPLPKRGIMPDLSIARSIDGIMDGVQEV